MDIDFSYRHLIVASLLFYCGIAAADTPETVANDSVATVEEVVEVQQAPVDPLAAEKKLYRERSVRLYEEDLADAVRGPYQLNKTEAVARRYRAYEKVHPIDTVTYTSEWLSDEFIQGYYYYLPLLDKYGDYTRELTSILGAIIGNLENQLKAGKIRYSPSGEWVFKEGTLLMLKSLKKTGRFKTPQNEYILEYGPIYDRREEGASIPYLDGLLAEIETIVKNITPFNAEESLTSLQNIKGKLAIRITDSSDRGSIGNSTRATIPEGAGGIIVSPQKHHSATYGKDKSGARKEASRSF